MSNPIWRIEIVKSYQGEQWANDWMTDTADMLEAQDLASGLIAFERHIHQIRVNFDYVLISSVQLADRVFRHLALNQPGQFVNDEYLPLFNTVRMDMGTADSDPCRKYFRIPIGENRITNGELNVDYIALLQGYVTSDLVTPLLLEAIVTGKGDKVVSANIFPRVQMRQLHRRRRPKLPPVIEV